MIVGTAGHIDHGKTSLVRALTGVDTDRLPEEKRRGITIELGFAPLELPDVGTVGVVDVPGHEAFVRTMLAGATGVDLALLVVAADEGVMPQTREHAAILELLGVRGGVVALTKSDLVDADWIALVADDVRALLASTPLANAAIVPTSATTGAGLDELRAALSQAARALPSRDASDIFRLPIDRAFSVAGAGTVVTGTVWSGTLARDASVRVWPGGRTARVRSIQSHSASVDEARPGTRAAIALAGIDVADVSRGGVIVRDEGWRETRVLRADVALLDTTEQQLGNRTRVRLHLGTVDVGARVIVAGGPLVRGERRPARVVLDEPIVARGGDRFVLRWASPPATLGGGVITDPLPPARARPWPTVGLTSAERMQAFLTEAGAHGVAVAELPVRLGMSPAACRKLVDETKGVRAIGGQLVATSAIAALRRELTSAVAAHHEANPLDAEVPLQLIRSRLHAPPEAIEAALESAQKGGDVVVTGAGIKLTSWEPRLNASLDDARAAILAELQSAGAEPPSVGELTAKHGAEVTSLLRLLERDGAVVKVENERYFATAPLAELVTRLRAAMPDGKVASPSELREALGISRKYLIPFLEYCDRVGHTARQADGRVWLGRGPVLSSRA